MSVKFEKETVKDAPLPGGRKHEVAHEIGERLTGGESAQGYLAVRYPLNPYIEINKANRSTIGLSRAAPKESPSHKDAHLRLARWPPRITRILDR